MMKKKNIKKLSGVIFQSGTGSTKTEEDFANSRARQKSIDSDTYRKQEGTSESVNPVPPSFGPERW